jgi:hypothetical protein
VVLDLVGQVHLPRVARHLLLGADAPHDVLWRGVARWGASRHVPET